MLKYNNLLINLLKNNKKILRIYLFFNKFYKNLDILKIRNILLDILKIKVDRAFNLEFIFLIDNDEINLDIINKIISMSFNPKLFHFLYFIINHDSIRSSEFLKELLSSEIVNSNMVEVVIVDKNTYWPDEMLRIVKRIDNDFYIVYKNPFYIESKKRLEEITSPELMRSIFQFHNTSNIIESFKYWYFKGIVIELSYKCNFICDHCYVDSSPFRNDKLDIESIKKFW
jgi:hypothetical protein